MLDIIIRGGECTTIGRAGRRRRPPPRMTVAQKDCVSRVATAQTYPSRPMTMVVTLPAGSTMDAAARLVAERMRQSLGQPIIIENVSGANGSIGTGVPHNEEYDIATNKWRV